MPPTQRTVTAAPTPTSTSSAGPPTHQPSIPAMIVLALFLSLMAALAIGVIFRQRRETAALKRHQETLGSSQEKQRPARTRPSWFSRFSSHSRWTAADAGMDDPTAVGALHATSVLLAAAPCQVFSPPMTMHFRIPFQDRTILILGAPWFPDRRRAQHCGASVFDCSRPYQQL